MVRIVSRAEQQKKNTTESKTATVPIRYALHHLKKKGLKLKKKSKSRKKRQQQIKGTHNDVEKVNKETTTTTNRS